MIDLKESSLDLSAVSVDADSLDLTVSLISCTALATKKIKKLNISSIIIIVIINKMK